MHSRDQYELHPKIKPNELGFHLIFKAKSVRVDTTLTFFVHRHSYIILVVFVVFVVTGCESQYEGSSAEEWFTQYNEASEEVEDLTYELENLQSEHDDLQYEYDELQKEYDDLESEFEEVVNCLDWARSYEDYQDCSY